MESSEYPSFLEPIRECDYSDWQRYEEDSYQIFLRDFVVSKVYFLSKQVNYRKHPYLLGREEAFWHVTTSGYDKESGNRDPDIRRHERIHWIRQTIDHVESCLKANKATEGVLVWSVPYRGNLRYRLYIHDERYLVVLEERADYVLLITSYFVEHEDEHRKLMKNARGAVAPPGTPSTRG